MEEFLKYIGVLLFSGIVLIPDKGRILSRKPGNICFNALRARKVMTRTRFEEISQVLCFYTAESLVSRNDSGYDPLQIVRWLVDAVSRNWRKLYRVGEKLSFDEIMIPCKGRVAFREYLSMKPTKYGIKVWGMFSSKTGYTCTIDIYSGKSAGISSPIHDTVISVTRGFLNKGHTIFLDKYLNLYT